MRPTRSFPLFLCLILAVAPSLRAQAQAPAPKAPAPPPAAASEDDEDAADAAAAEAEAKEAEAAEAAEGKEAEEAEAGDDLGDDDLGEENPGRPPPKGKGVVWGVLKDNEGELIEAPVQVVGKKKAEAVTDEEGRYRLELAPGTYSLRFSYELHKSTRIDHVIVEAGKVVRLDAQLLSDEEAVNVVEVVEEADKSTVEGTALARQKSTSVGDSVGRSEIARTPAANAAQAAQRVVGATIIGGRFVYVRGLGERYTNALLNNAPLPSPEPDRAAVPLDVFPSLIIDSLSIVKTFTPDSPADFAGGSVRIQTRELPTKPLIQGSISLGVDDGSTFTHRLGQRGSDTDWLGYDDGTRNLPKALRGGILVTPEDVHDKTDPLYPHYIEAAQGLNSYMSATRPWTPPNYSVSGVVGDGWALGNDSRLGALLTINYSRAYTRNEDGMARTYSADGMGGLTRLNDYRLGFGNDKVTWGSLGSVSYWPSARHRLTLIGIHTQIADSTGQVVAGHSDDRSAEIVSTRLRYVSRALNFGQLRGEHDFPDLVSARLEWNAAVSGASRNEPDTRDTVFQSSQGSAYSAPNTPESGSHLHAEQGETALGGGLDWTQPIARDAEATKFKVGGLVSAKSRDFKARRFHFYPENDPITRIPIDYSCGLTVPRGCPDGLYTPDNIDSGVLGLQEDTHAEDAYKASLNVYAGYAMVDWAIMKDLRVIGGARLEVTKQKLEPYSQFGTASNPKKSRVDATDVLPAVNVAYSATKRTKLRAAVTRTLARPQLRELSPFTFSNYFGAMPFAGNQDLKLTYINNYDTRLEFYPTLREVLAFSFFYKTFTDPIENVVVDTGGGVLKPQNSKGAKLEGIELEARKSLDFVDALRDFSVIANLTLARSKIEIDTSGTSPLAVTTLSRPLVNQAPYVINVALDYNNDPLEFGGRVLFNVSGKRIVEVGSKGVPDAYLLPQPSLDVTLHKGIAKHFDVKLTATNLIAADTIVTVKPTGGNERVLRRHYDGQSLYSDSRIFSVSGAYTY